MSALGHKRTCAAQNGMSALPPKAGMCGPQEEPRWTRNDVRFGHKQIFRGATAMSALPPKQTIVALVFAVARFLRIFQPYPGSNEIRGVKALAKKSVRFGKLSAARAGIFRQIR